jgi:SPP1 gp7 family putative phage head morphogenesis protein
METVLAELDERLPQEFPDSQVREEATQAGRKLNDRNRKLFFAAVSASTGLVLLNSDDPEERTPGIEALAGGALGLAAGLAIFGGRGPGVAPKPGRLPVPPAIFPSRPGVSVLVKVNTNPLLFVDTFANESVRHISTLRAGVVDGVRDSIVREVVLGEGDPEKLTRDLLNQWERDGVPSKIPTRRLTKAGLPVEVNAEAHAALIARDQIGTLNMELSRERQTAAGITEFKWISRRDGRVRASHRDRDRGQSFTWENGANGEFPGGPVNCRCRAQAVINPDAVREAAEFVPLAS